MGQKDYIPIRKLKTRLPNTIIDNIVKSDYIDTIKTEEVHKTDKPIHQSFDDKPEVENLHSIDETLVFLDVDDKPKRFQKLKFLGVVLFLITFFTFAFTLMLNNLTSEPKHRLKNYEIDFENLTKVFGDDAYIVTGEVNDSYPEFLDNLDRGKRDYVEDFINDVIRNNKSYSDIITKMNYEQTAGFLQILIDRFTDDYLDGKKVKVIIDEDMLIFCDLSPYGDEIVLNPRLIDAGIIDLNDAIYLLFRVVMANESFQYKIDIADASQITFTAFEGDRSGGVRKVALELNRSPGVERYDNSSPKPITIDTQKIDYTYHLPSYPGFGELAKKYALEIESYLLADSTDKNYKSINIIYDGDIKKFTEIEISYPTSNIFSSAELITQGVHKTFQKSPYVSLGRHIVSPLARKYEYIYSRFSNGQAIRVVDEMGTVIKPKITLGYFDYSIIENLNFNMSPIAISSDSVEFDIEADHYKYNVWICVEAVSGDDNRCSKMYDEHLNIKYFTFPRTFEGDYFKFKPGNDYMFSLRYTIKNEDHALTKLLFEEDIDPSTDVSIVINQKPFLVSIPKASTEGNDNTGDSDEDNSGK